MIDVMSVCSQKLINSVMTGFALKEKRSVSGVNVPFIGLAQE